MVSFIYLATVFSNKMPRLVQETICWQSCWTSVQDDQDWVQVRSLETLLLLLLWQNHFYSSMHYLLLLPVELCMIYFNYLFMSEMFQMGRYCPFLPRFLWLVSWHLPLSSHLCCQWRGPREDQRSRGRNGLLDGTQTQVLQEAQVVREGAGGWFTYKLELYEWVSKIQRVCWERFQTYNVRMLSTEDWLLPPVDNTMLSLDGFPLIVCSLVRPC